MFILIDKEQMCVRYKHHTQACLTNLMHIELSHVAASVIACDWPGAFAGFTDMELKLLYQNLCGQKYASYSRELLVQNVQAFCMSIEESKLNALELSLQAGYLSEGNDNFYKHRPGHNQPQALSEVYTPAALTAVPGCVPIVTPTPTVNAAPASYTQTANAPIARTRPVSDGPPEQPKAGSKTGRVWEIAEMIWQKSGCASNIKAMRKEIIEACEGEGINSSTASVQFGKWKSTKGA